MKKFPFKFSTSVIILTSLISVVFIGGIVFNVFLLAGENYYLPTIVISGAVEIVALILTLSAVFISRYTVKNGYLYCRVGLIVFKTPLAECDEITLFDKLGKIVLYRKNGKYSVIITSAEVFDELADAIIKENPEIKKSRQYES